MHKENSSKKASAQAAPGVAAPGVDGKSMGKKQMSRAAAVADTFATTSHAAAFATYRGALDQVPQISAVAGSALQADIADVNRAMIRLLKTAARLGEAEPLAHLLLGTSQDMIELFLDPANSERLLAQAIGFPLVQLRIHDVGVMRQMLTDGLVSASSVQCLTKTFPLEVLESATRSSRLGV